MSDSQYPSSQGSYGNPLIPFQVESLSIADKSDFSWGKQLAQYIEAKVNGGTSSHFWVRNAQWKTNRNLANGVVNMSRFRDLLEFNGKVNYINLNWLPIHIVNRIVSGLVGRWMNKDEKISVKAIDTLSTKQKKEEYDYLQFVIDKKAQLQQIQEQSGVQMVPQGDGLPEDQDQLKLWQAQFQRLPEEICYELGINECLAANGWFDTLKEKMLHDSAETGFVATYTWMDKEGIIHVEWLKPENCIYSYSSYPDFRDTSWRGYMNTIKISDLRKRYGKEFNPNNPNALSEEDIYRLARTAKEYQLYDNITWNTEYNVTFLRPYDEYNVDIIEFELKTLDNEPYTVVTTKGNGSTIIKKGYPKKKKDNEEVITDSKINIYRGVYARNTMQMLEWGLKDNMIRPQDPKEIGNAEFSYSFYMVQSYDMRSLGVPEKIQEPADQMILARLKIQQLVAKMVPAGAAINWDALQEIDYGLGDGNKSIDVVKMFEQTGRLYWRGRDAEGNPIPVPYVEMPNSGFYNQMKALVELYQFHYQVMKDELGEDPNLVSQAAQPRVAAQNIEVSQQQAEFATDYYYLAYVRCMEDTSRKISCLLKDSVDSGAEVYRHIIGDDADMSKRIFSTRIQLLPTAYELQRFDAMMQQVLNTTPEMALFVDPFQMMRVAKEDVKLAETLFRQAQKKMLLWQQQMQQQNQQMTIQGQIQSAQAAEQAKGQNLQMELAMKNAQSDAQGKVDKEKIVLQGVFALATAMYAPQKADANGNVPKAQDLPPELMELMKLSIKNIAIPLAQDNVMLQHPELAAQAQQEDQQSQQPQQDQQQVAA